MESAFFIFLYGVTVVLLSVCFLKDKAKALLSLKKAWLMFANILPQLLSILLLVRLLIVIIKPDIIQRIIGTDSGCIGMVFASFLGAISMVPVIIAFPVTATLMKSGAGITQIAVFISTLTMVGFITIPIEIEYFGKKVALLRNILSFLFAFPTAFIIGAILT